MNNIPPKLRERLNADPFYKVCSMRHLPGHICKGKVTWEHVVIFAGKQLQERWAIIPLCEYGHAVNSHLDGPGLDKRKNLWIATQRATVVELKAISKAEDYVRKAQKLGEEYGGYNEAECLAWKPMEAQSPISKPEEQKKLAWNDARRETFWVPIHNHDVRLMIQSCIDHHNKVEGIKYSPWEMINRMIVSYADEVKLIERELKTEDYVLDKSERQ